MPDPNEDLENVLARENRAASVAACEAAEAEAKKAPDVPAAADLATADPKPPKRAK